MFYFPEAGGYLCQEVTDAVESYLGTASPPTVPCRKDPLSPQEIVEFILDKHCSMLPGTRGYGTVTAESGEARPWTLYQFFSTQMLWFMKFFEEFPRKFKSSTDRLKNFRLRSPDSDTPEQAAAYRWLGEMFGLRLKYRELAQAEMDLESVRPTNPGILTFARALEGKVSIILINFSGESVRTGLRLLNLKTLGFQEGEHRQVRDILREVKGEENRRMVTTKVQIHRGEILKLELPAQNGAVLRFE